MSFLFSFIRQAILASISAFFIFAHAQQVDFENYVPLRAQGKVPEFFSSTSQQKVDEAAIKSRDNMDDALKNEFLEYIHYGIDELLYSGLIVYGDPATKYIDRVAAKLLEKHPKLKRELQFYTIKSNVANALSTDQGVIFVTSGLLSQLENEAQLAYVLSHEIAHFQEGHVEKSYTEKIATIEEMDYDERIEKLSNHSKEQELSADKLGIKLYNEAGYKRSELISAFDVMMYSYLPFDEEPLPKTYFNSTHVFVPSNLFPEEINKIQVDEDYDDEKSTHPNIRKRKEAVVKALESYSNWGSDVFLVDEETFKTVRNIARFEGLRLDLLNTSFGDALYSIFLLEKDFPNNLYIHRCKSQAWLGLVAYKENGKYTAALQKPSKVEGESHAMHYFLYNLSKIELMTMALRMIHDSKVAFPEDDEIQAVYERMVEYVVDYRKFKLEDYSELTYEQALEEFENSKIELQRQQDLEEADTLNTTTEELSKYDKIKIKKEGVVALDVEQEFNTEKFYIYALADIKKDNGFNELYAKYTEKAAEKQAEEDAWYALSRKERTKQEMKKETTITEVVLLDPSFMKIDNYQFLPKESKELEGQIIENIKTQGERCGIAVYDLTDVDRNKMDTEGYNERAILSDFLRQKAEYLETEMFPVDYTALKSIKDHYGEAEIMFVYGEHIRNMHIPTGAIIAGILLPPFGIPYFTARLVTGNKYVLDVVLVNMETGEIRTTDTFLARQKPNKSVLKASAYYVMSQLNGSRK